MFRGVVGSIKWAYFTAAAINGYAVARVGTSYRLRGTVVLSDAYNLTQRPLFFIAPFQGGEFRWPIENMEIRAGTIEATLGKLETITHGQNALRPT